MKIPGWLEENQPVAGGTNSAIIQPQLGCSGAKISGRENLNLFYFPLIGLVWRNLGLPVFFLALTWWSRHVLKIKQFQLHNFIKTCEHFMYSQHCQSASRASWIILLLCVWIVFLYILLLVAPSQNSWGKSNIWPRKERSQSKNRFGTVDNENCIFVQFGAMRNSIIPILFSSISWVQPFDIVLLV